MIEWKITNSQVCLETFKCDQAMLWEALKYHGVPHKDNPHMVFVEKEKQTSMAAAEGQVKSGLSSFPSCYSVAEERVEGVCCQGLWGVLPSQGACHLGWHRTLWAHKIKVTFNTLCLQYSCREALLFVSQDVGILHTPPPPRPNYTTPHHTTQANQHYGQRVSFVISPGPICRIFTFTRHLCEHSVHGASISLCAMGRLSPSTAQNH